MSCGELAGDLKINREGRLTKHVGFVYAGVSMGMGFL